MFQGAGWRLKRFRLFVTSVSGFGIINREVKAEISLINSSLSPMAFEMHKVRQICNTKNWKRRGENHEEDPDYRSVVSLCRVRSSDGWHPDEPGADQSWSHQDADPDGQIAVWENPKIRNR